MVTAKLICVFVFAYAKSRFSHDEAHFSYFALKRGLCVVVRLNETVQTCKHNVSFEQRKKQSQFSDETVIIYNREKSNLGYTVMRVNIMLRKSPFLQSPFLQPRPTAERLNCFSYKSKIFYTEMVNVNRKTLCGQTLNLSRVMRKLDFIKNKGADYLRS